MELRREAVLITGGSRGLGAALGEELAVRGARVVLVARGGGALDATVTRIRARGGEAHGIVADVGAPGVATRLAAEAAALVGDVSILVHAASSLGPVPLAPLADARDEEVDEAIAVNLRAPLLLTRAIAGGMAVRGRGLVVFVSSDAAVEAYPRWGVYGATKAAADHLARTWAEELRGTGVRVVSVDPGEMDTAMHAAAMPDADRTLLARPDDVARRMVALFGDAERAPSGARVSAASFGLAPGPAVEVRP